MFSKSKNLKVRILVGDEAGKVCLARKSYATHCDQCGTRTTEAKCPNCGSRAVPVYLVSEGGFYSGADVEEL